MLTILYLKEQRSETYRSVMGLLHATPEVHELLDSSVASRRYATQTDYRFRSLKTMVLVDCSTGVILDIHFCEPIALLRDYSRGHSDFLLRNVT